MNSSVGIFVGAGGGISRGADCDGYGEHATLCASLTVEVCGSDAGSRISSGLLIVGHHSQTGHYSVDHATPLSLFSRGVEKFSLFAAHQAAFVSTVPSGTVASFQMAGDAVGWWLQSPILLTKGVSDRVLTMGYVELNARDSFWTTMLHAHTWPSLEAAMIRESCEFQCTEGGGPPSYCQGDAAGKIPTCILPTIVRDDNVDITAFFVLRVGRYFAATGDETLLEEIYPCLRAALHYLMSRCPHGEALPVAREDSYWGSWLDVPFLKGRRLIVDNSAVYLAALRVGAQAAKLLAARIIQRAAQSAALEKVGLRGGRVDNGTLTPGSLAFFKFDAAHFSSAFSKGQAQFLLPPPPLGLGQWNESRGSLVDTWWGESGPSNYSLGDQFMAAFFSILPAKHSKSMLRYLSPGANEGSGLEGPFGIRALYPYLPHATDPWGGEYPPGVYANGGSYAWLTCGASLSLLWGGEEEAGHRVWSALSHQMLFGEHGGMPHVPYEYLHSDTGKAMGNAPQGWDGVCGAWAWLGGGIGWWRESPVWAWPPGGKDTREDKERFNLGAAYRLNEPGLWHKHTYHLSFKSPPTVDLLLPLTSFSSVNSSSSESSYFFVLDSHHGKGSVAHGLKEWVGSQESPHTFLWESVSPCDVAPRQPSRLACKFSLQSGENTEVVILINDS